MKHLLTFVTLAVLAAACNSASVQVANRANLNVGVTRPGDYLLQRRIVSQPARPNIIQYQDYVYQGYARTNITAIRAFENGWSQYASAYIVSGGLGRNFVTIRLQSVKCYGFNNTIEIYGR